MFSTTAPQHKTFLAPQPPFHHLPTFDLDEALLGELVLHSAAPAILGTVGIV